MKIVAAEARLHEVPLTVSYRIAGRSFDRAAMVLVTLRDDGGHVGYGSATPVRDLSGDDALSALAALEGAILPALTAYADQPKQATDHADQPKQVTAQADRPKPQATAYTDRPIPPSADQSMEGAPLVEAAMACARAASPDTRAALAAADIALHDLAAKRLGVPLAAMLGGVRRPLVTSVTVGIDDAAVMAEAAAIHVGRGFRILKIKIGEDAGADIDRLEAVRRAVGSDILLRVDANEGYSGAEASRVARALERLGIELFEQPVARGDLEGLRSVTGKTRVPVVADESVKLAEDLDPLIGAAAARGANIKLMKCGGIVEARRIDRRLAAAGWSSLVGCMDESCVSIAAAAHFAASAASTAWVDLDGHLDLAADPFRGGVALRDGALLLSGGPGLGVEPA